MKAVLVIPTLTSGGAERVISELANEWCNTIDVTVVVLYKAPIHYDIDRKVKIKCLSSKPVGTRLGRVRQQIVNFYRFRKLVKSENPDFVLSFLTKFNIVNLLALIGCSVRVYVSDRSNVKAELNKTTRFFRKYVYRISNGIICQTNFQLEEVLETFGDIPAICINNPIRKVKCKSNFETNYRILTIGRLSPEKGHERMLRIFSTANIPEWKLTIVGAGPLLDELKSLAQNLKIADRVEFYGTTKNVDELFQSHDIFLFTSFFEGFPNALAEAMCAGLACISYDCVSGPAELINNNENGFLIDEGDQNTFVEKLEILASNSELRKSFGVKAIESVSKLSTSDISKKYRDFCSE